MNGQQFSILDRFLIRVFNRAIRLSGASSGAPQGARCIGDASLLELGLNVSFGGEVILFAVAPIRICDYTMIGFGSILHTATHDYTKHPMWAVGVGRPIHVGAHVWIGTHAIILAGVQIADYAVVGGGAVVSANVPAGAIVAGNPARIIKMRNPEAYSQIPTMLDNVAAEFIVGKPQTHICKWK